MILFNKFELLRAFAQVLDLVNVTMASHQERTAYIADQLCHRLPVKPSEHQRVVMAALLHDVGVVPLGLRADDLLLERDLDQHSQAGWMFVHTCPLLLEESRLIRYHHYDWLDILNLSEDHRRSGKLANIIHMADSLDIDARTEVGIDSLVGELTYKSGSVFATKVVEAALDFLAGPKALQAVTSTFRDLTLNDGASLELTMDDLTAFARLFAQIIDSRSSFTATHSTGVAHLSSLLYFLSEGDDSESEAMFLAGLLHDVGKLGVPLSLMEKMNPLTDREMAQFREHALISYQFLSDLPGFHRIALWGGLHHEKMNGAGYPFGLSGADIPLEARLMAAADVLTALTEDRPYRRWMTDDEAIKIMSKMVKAGELDGDVVSMVTRHLKDFREPRIITY